MLAATAARKPTARLRMRVNCLSVTCFSLQSIILLRSFSAFMSCIYCAEFPFVVVYLIIFTSPFSESFIMLDGLCGLCSCRREKHT